ncbi:MAG: hypothetical protein FAZ92_00895 [Accumulibacter sp.]|uniref:transposase family protein n=1 Tax=Accumulibacter sp. TaxID=2053492 RepID=UPI0012034568|nr:transposase family protein [Accumulibacter sp.]TLD46815.1 MAG: hypothetical protein FAZ92_00895 [Accumulibacter sp.]
MSKPCRRPTRAGIRAQRSDKRRQEQALNAKRRAMGQRPQSPPPLPNRCSAFTTIDEERAAREHAVSKQARLLRQELPALLDQLERIPDPRAPRKRRHKLTALLLYGLLMFVFQFASRRETNREMTRPQFLANLQLLFPQIEALPHADTLYRLLRDIDLTQLEQAHVDLVRRLIRGKSFRRYLINHCHPIAIDGSQKLAGDTLWAEELLQRSVGKDENRHTQYFVYVLEASLVFHGGLVIPLLSEFLEHALGDSEAQKQDCELRGFARLSDRLKRLFPRLPILLVLDGLYANGPVMQRCLRAGWQFMIVLRDKDLPSVWEEFRTLQPRQSQTRQLDWGKRQQHFSWVNDIEYAFGANGRCRLKLHVVVCEESWQRVDPQAAIVTETARHAWLSSRPLSCENVHARCNLGARHRWGIEAGFLVEKHQGYHYEHAFALDWNAMRGYHLLMRLAHVFNTLARFTRQLRDLFDQLGVRGAIAFIRNSCAAPWLDSARMRVLLARRFLLQLE